VAVIGGSQGLYGAVWAQAPLRRVLSVIGARVVDRELPIAVVHEALDGEGRLIDPGQRRRLDEIVRLLAEQARADPPTGLAA
jgi:chromate reductase, NAD(P)H dehydrogenase (quinone)